MMRGIKNIWLIGTVLITGFAVVGTTNARASQGYAHTAPVTIKKKTYYTTNRSAATYRDNAGNARWTFKRNHALKNYAGTRWTVSRQMMITKNGKVQRYYWVKNSRNGASGWVWSGYLKAVGSAENRVTNLKTDKKAGQIVTVVQNGASTATLQLWSKNKGGIWQKKLTAASRIGPNGIGPSREGSSKTPVGAYHLSFAFGKAAKVKTGGIGYRKIQKTTYWIEDLADPQYNTWQNRSWANAKNEHLSDYTKAAPHNQYQLAVVMDNYGMNNGSGFFIHVKNQWATAGCVSISLGNMKKLIGQLGTRAYVVNAKSTSQLTHY